jgi:hypothetical protein
MIRSRRFNTTAPIYLTVDCATCLEEGGGICLEILVCVCVCGFCAAQASELQRQDGGFGRSNKPVHGAQR